MLNKSTFLTRWEIVAIERALADMRDPGKGTNRHRRRLQALIDKIAPAEKIHITYK